MDRRNILKSIAALPLIPIAIGNQTVSAAPIGQGKKYIVFADMHSVDVESFMSTPTDYPLAGATVHFIDVPDGKSIADCIAIYDLSAAESTENAHKIGVK